MPTPVNFNHNSRLVSITTGIDHSFALFEDGTVLGWGQGKKQFLAN